MFTSENYFFHQRYSKVVLDDIDKLAAVSCGVNWMLIWDLFFFFSLWGENKRTGKRKAVLKRGFPQVGSYGF